MTDYLARALEQERDGNEALEEKAPAEELEAALRAAGAARRAGLARAQRGRTGSEGTGNGPEETGQSGPALAEEAPGDPGDAASRREPGPDSSIPARLRLEPEESGSTLDRALRAAQSRGSGDTALRPAAGTLAADGLERALRKIQAGTAFALGRQRTLTVTLPQEPADRTGWDIGALDRAVERDARRYGGGTELF